MARVLQLGSIVWAEIADANGIRKLRPAVVVTPTDRLSDAGPLHVVAVTSRLIDPAAGRSRLASLACSRPSEDGP